MMTCMLLTFIYHAAFIHKEFYKEKKEKENQSLTLNLNTKISKNFSLNSGHIS